MVRLLPLVVPPSVRIPRFFRRPRAAHDADRQRDAVDQVVHPVPLARDVCSPPRPRSSPRRSGSGRAGSRRPPRPSSSSHGPRNRSLRVIPGSAVAARSPGRRGACCSPAGRREAAGLREHPRLSLRGPVVGVPDHRVRELDGVHGLRRVLGGDCDADGVRSQRASVAPRGGPFAQRGSTGFPGAVIPTCRPMWDASARRRRSEHRLVACPPGGAGVVPKKWAARGTAAALGPVAWPPPGSEAKVPVLSQIPQRPRGLPGDPPDVGALRGPLGPMFRCPFPSVPGDIGDRNMGT
jgi:hypothetical protein